MPPSNWILDIGKTVLEVLVMIAVVVSVSYAMTGTWNIGFAVESGSMEPNMHIGDLIFVVSASRTDIITYEEGKNIDYKSFGDYGDVIIYRPNGRSDATPIIHRAMKWIEKGERMPDGRPAPHSGYITKGDNNLFPDQVALSVNGERIEPVRKEWIIGVARFGIPYLGYPSLALHRFLSQIGFLPLTAALLK